MVHAYIQRMPSAICNVFGSTVLLNRFLENFGYGWSWPPCSPDMNPCGYFLWGHLKDGKPHTVQELRKLKLLVIRSEVTFWWHSSQIYDSFVASPQGRRTLYWARVHMEATCIYSLHECELSFVYHMLLCLRELRTNRTLKLLRVFWTFCIFV
jgi:hypothetical protein